MTMPILRQIAQLQDRSQDELKAMWSEYFGEAPPAYRRGFLVRGLAQRIQELTYGGLAADYQKRLDALVDDLPKGKGPEEDELDADERKEIVADAVIEFEGALLAAYRSEQKISPMAVFIATLENAEAIEERMRALDMAVRIHIKTADSYGLVITTAVPERNADLPTEPQAE